MNFHNCPSSWTRESTGSTVVPATSSTTERSSPAILFSSEDLPTFGLPTSATRRGPCTIVLVRGVPGKDSTILSSTSAPPRPCCADTGKGSPRPSPHSSATSPYWESESNLLATRITGTEDRCSLRAMISSVSVMPTLLSTTSTMTSAVSMAVSACRAIAPWMPFTLGSQPPVSCTQYLRPFQSAR